MTAVCNDVLSSLRRDVAKEWKEKTNAFQSEIAHVAMEEKVDGFVERRRSFFSGIAIKWNQSRQISN
jgi:hypothetical protein